MRSVFFKLLASFVFLIHLFVLGCRSGNGTSMYPDQRELFLSDPQNKGYQLSETSLHELYLQETRSFERSVMALRRVQQEFNNNNEVISFIEKLITRLEKYYDISMDDTEEEKLFKDGLLEKDRFFRYSYEIGDSYEMGILVIRDGKILRKFPE